MPDFEQDSRSQLLTREKQGLQRPPKYRVLIHNDDYTPMDFVVWVLEEVFHKDHAEATRIMLDVHRKGQGVAGVYTYEIAETKAARVETLAKAHEHPLRSSIEAE